MHYYLVWVSSSQFKGSTPLTYHYNGTLKDGSIVKVPFRNKQIIGLVDSESAKPDFVTKEIISLVIEEHLPSSSLELLRWFSYYYPAPSASHLQLFLPSYLTDVKETVPKEDSPNEPIAVKLPSLTMQQKQAISDINSSEARTVLLHGETGSGKTRVYIELIKNVFKQSRSAIVLTPEIGMTQQLISILTSSFPGQVVLMHSSLTPKTRRNNWLRIMRAKSPQIIVGPRSAVFSPIDNVGLIVMDEAHEASYKQEQSPYYQTTRVAARLCEISGAQLVLGTATPLVSDYYVMKSKGLLTVRMTEPAISHDINNKVDIQTVKLNDRANFSRSRWLSDQLIESISKSLSGKEQSIVFLNRRGTAQVILCQSCGWQALCPNCDTSLTYHGDSHTMLCHSCSFRNTVPAMCPNCSSPDIIFKGAGTKAITEELTKFFPSAKISRFDRDNKKSDSLEQSYNDLKTGKIDIAVGTQIITKGLDLPGLSTVGVVMADSGLYFPDYMSEERTFQNLMQVIGRVARGHIPGRVIIQTYHPESLAIKSAANKDFINFYDQQLVERRRYGFPPFVYLLKINSKKSTPKSAEFACNKLIEEIKLLRLPIKINGPSPAFHEKQNGKYIWQLVIKSVNRSDLLKIIKKLPSSFSYDLDPASLL